MSRNTQSVMRAFASGQVTVQPANDSDPGTALLLHQQWTKAHRNFTLSAVLVDRELGIICAYTQRGVAGLTGLHYRSVVPIGSRSIAGCTWDFAQVLCGILKISTNIARNPRIFQGSEKHPQFMIIDPAECFGIVVDSQVDSKKLIKGR